MSPDWQPLTQLDSIALQTESITKIGDSTQYSMYCVRRKCLIRKINTIVKLGSKYCFCTLQKHTKDNDRKAS